MCRLKNTGTATFIISGDAVLRAKLLEIFHKSPVGGYLGVYHMFHQLSHRCYWQGMYHNRQTLIHNYPIC